MPSYLTVDQFKDLTVMPDEYVDAIEAVKPGWVLAQLTHWSSQIDARLRKRYNVPFSDPVPEVVKMWLARLVTLRAYIRRGIDPADEQFTEVKEDASNALVELKEAADSETGLYDLPLRQDTRATGVSKGGPFGYSEASPYVWLDEQYDRGKREDSSGGGTFD